MEGIKKDGAKSFDAIMPECQNAGMSECQNVGHDGSEGRRGGTGFRMPSRRRA